MATAVPVSPSPSGSSPQAVIEATLAALRIPALVVSATTGPRVVRYGLRPAAGIRVARLLRSGPDLALAKG